MNVRIMAGFPGKIFFPKTLVFFLVIVFLATAPIFSVAAEAMGVSPAGVILDPFIPGKVKIVTITVGRIRSDSVSYISSDVRGDIKKFVTVVGSDDLNIPTGSKSIPVQIKFDGTNLKKGEKYSGQIIFREMPAKGEESSMGNFPGVAFDVTISVSDDDTSLLQIGGISYSWDEDKKIFKYSFKVNNERYEPARVQKAIFSFVPVDDPGTKIVREVEINGEILEPGMDQQLMRDLPLDGKIFVGDYNITIEFFDVQGRSVFVSTPIEIFVNQMQAKINRRKSRYIMVTIVFLSLAALTMGDFVYIRRKRKKRQMNP